MDSNLKYSKGLLLLCDDNNMPMERFEVIIFGLELIIGGCILFYKRNINELVKIKRKSTRYGCPSVLLTAVSYPGESLQYRDLLSSAARSRAYLKTSAYVWCASNRRSTCRKYTGP